MAKPRFWNRHPEWVLVAKPRFWNTDYGPPEVGRGIAGVGVGNNTTRMRTEMGLRCPFGTLGGCAQIWGLMANLIPSNEILVAKPRFSDPDPDSLIPSNEILAPVLVANFIPSNEILVANRPRLARVGVGVGNNTTRMCTQMEFSCPVLLG